MGNSLRKGARANGLLANGLSRRNIVRLGNSLLATGVVQFVINLF